MNVQLAAKVRHMRGSEDMQAIRAAAAIRYERRAKAFRAEYDKGWPTPALWRALDLVHEATALTFRLEDRAQDIEDAAAERYWLGIYAEQANA